MSSGERRKRTADSSGYAKAKLDLCDRLRRDTSMSVSGRLVGAEIVCRSWESSGCTDAQGWFVTVLGISLRTVKDAIAELRDRGYIKVERTGRSNVYVIQLVQKLPLSGDGAKDARQQSAEIGGHGDQVQKRTIGAENGSDRCKKGPTIGAENALLTSLEPFAQPALEGEQDSDGDGRCAPARTIGSAKNEATELFLKLIEIAGLPSDRPLPLHWQGGEDVVSMWLQQGWTPDEILAGASLTMDHKPTPEPPASIEYFDQEIDRVARKRNERAGYAKREATAVSARIDCQRLLNELAEKHLGWNIIAELSTDQAADLVNRYSRGDLSADDLHRLRNEVTTRLSVKAARA
jgi:hypothetical protein